MKNEWSIQQISRLAGTTSRTLRHYDQVGLLPPTRIGANGYRYYDRAALVRLQRILLLRELGLGLEQIAEVLRRSEAEVPALRAHLRVLRREQERRDRQIAAVEATIVSLEREGDIPVNDMFDGFGHTQYEEEVTRKWGREAWESSDRWWRALDAPARAEWMERLRALNAAWQDAASRGIDPAGDDAQELAARHLAWLRGVPGAPADTDEHAAAYLRGLGEMYVADERFAANYGGVAGATFVRDALAVLAGRLAGSR